MENAELATLSRAWLNPAETGIPDAMLHAVLAPYGLVIFAGSANSGKYMTAYSTIEQDIQRLQQEGIISSV